MTLTLQQGNRFDFPSEAEAVKYLHQRLNPYFKILQEVQMRHMDGTRVRMDMLLRPRHDVLIAQRFGLIGIELKAGHKALRNFHAALKQAIDYRHSVVIDRRAARFNGATPEFVFVYPAFPNGRYENWHRGSMRLAGMFNVGTIHELTHWNAGTIEFRVSDSPIWRSNQGIVGHINFGTARRRGAA